MSLRYRITAVLFFMITALLYAAPDYQLHRVEPGESLSSLARVYNCSIKDLKEMNSLERDMLFRGEELRVPLVYPDTHKVAAGDTLSGIAQRYGIDQEKLVSLNRMNHSVLKTGQVLELIRPPLSGEKWEVRRGDSLSWLSLKFDISQERLKQINGMNSSSLRVGQRLNLTDSRPQTITIGEGDSLWAVSKKYGVSIEDLKAWNNLDSDLLRNGLSLQLYPVVLELDERDRRFITGAAAGTVLASADTDGAETTSAAAGREADKLTTEPELKLAALNLSPALYYSIPTRRRTQPNASYAEEDLDDSMHNYGKARALLQNFDEAVHKLPALGRELKGYTIVIDPGHGGLDPGAVVSNSDGNGNTVYVVEDEYAYDIALRVYRDLVRHGADAGLTVISPNHTIRRTEDASITYVNEKNEVYNSRAVNSLDRNHVWPVGGEWGLDQRKVVASEILNGKRRKTVFISIHADNNPGDGAGTRILYHPEERGTLSQELAEVLTGHMGLGSAERAQEVRVLQDNPASAAVLVEVRNLAYKNNAWAIRNEDLRQDDADRIVNGILSYCNSQ